MNEGATANFTLTTTNITSGTSVPYTLSGISAADVSGGSLTGNAVVNSSGVATISVSPLNDLLTEGAETLTVTAGGATASTVVNDTSKTATYSLSASSSSVNEGSTATFTLTTTNVTSGTSVAYTLLSVSAADIAGGLLSGSATVNSSGTATITVPIAADLLTEGAETLTVTAQGASTVVTINDTSLSVPTYSLSAANASVNEGSIAAFSLVTTNVAPGTSISYTITGVSTADITGGLTGTATVDANGIAAINMAVAADFLTEGAETLTVTAQGKSASMTVNDTSTAAAVLAYAISAASSSVDEGAVAVFELTTSNVAGGTSVAYTITGVSAADITGGALSGVAIVNTSGTATISLPMVADFLTEGAETLTVTAQGKSASMTINDTSKAAVTVRTGTATADTINNSAASENIDGGAGTDTLVYTSNSTTVVISKSDGNTVVTNITTGEVDTLTDVERLKFADTAIAFDTSGVGGQTYRVYKAAFNRTPDVGGLGFWISGMDGGASLSAVAQGFVNSAEFKAVYGASPTNAQIVTRFYDNVLGRAAESGGYNYWLGILDSGNANVAQVLASFSESPENQAAVIGVIGKGILYTPYG